MLDTAFFMTMGGLGVSLAGFGGLFSALYHGDGQMAQAVYRWRMREIVTSSFRLAFLGFGTVVLYGFTDDVQTTARLISALAVISGAVNVATSMKPGPAWGNERDRIGAIVGSTFWIVIIAVNVVAGSHNYLRLVMLLLLLSPALVFVRATVDATRSADEPAALEE